MRLFNVPLSPVCPVTWKLDLEASLDSDTFLARIPTPGSITLHHIRRIPLGGYDIQWCWAYLLLHWLVACRVSPVVNSLVCALCNKPLWADVLAPGEYSALWWLCPRFLHNPYLSLPEPVTALAFAKLWFCYCSFYTFSWHSSTEKSSSILFF